MRSGTLTKLSLTSMFSLPICDILACPTLTHLELFNYSGAFQYLVPDPSSQQSYTLTHLEVYETTFVPLPFLTCCPNLSEIQFHGRFDPCPSEHMIDVYKSRAPHQLPFSKLTSLRFKWFWAGDWDCIIDAAEALGIRAFPSLKQLCVEVPPDPEFDSNVSLQRLASHAARLAEVSLPGGLAQWCIHTSTDAHRQIEELSVIWPAFYASNENFKSTVNALSRMRMPRLRFLTLNATVIVDEDGIEGVISDTQHLTDVLMDEGEGDERRFPELEYAELVLRTRAEYIGNERTEWISSEWEKGIKPGLDRLERDGRAFFNITFLPAAQKETVGYIRSRW